MSGITRDGEKEKVVQAAAGISFSLVLTESGKGTSVRNPCCFSLGVNREIVVFSFGSAEKGQLGNGTTGERITTGNKTAFDIESSPGQSMLHVSFSLSNHRGSVVYIKELDGKHIVQIASGQQHSLAVDSTGYDLHAAAPFALSVPHSYVYSF